MASTPTIDTYTRCRHDGSASSRFAVCRRSVRPIRRSEAACTTSSAPAPASATPSPLARSPTCVPAPGRRDRTRTVWPRAPRMGTRCRPSVPLPPVTRTMLMVPSYQVGLSRRASETFKTPGAPAVSVLGMKLQLALLELVVADMAATLAFYRRVGLDIPPDADQEPHVDVELSGGLRLAFDTEDTIRSFDPQWSRPPGGGYRVALAFACESPAA